MSDVSTFTKGPWIVGRFDRHGVVTGNGQLICTTRSTYDNRTKEEEIANARLIAAAPQMLEALHEIVNHSLEFDVDVMHFIAAEAIKLAEEGK